jgi:pimeloyl-ACP methyl ester carboxylesterase
MSHSPLIFFPGTLCDERVFIPLWSELALDKKAFVPLQWAEDLPQMESLSMDRLAYFDEPVHLVGYSMGAYIAALTAIREAVTTKDKSKRKVASLSLLSSSGTELTGSEIKLRKSLLQAIKKKQYKGMTQARINFMLHENNLNDPALCAMIKAMSDDLGPATLAAQTESTTTRKNLLSALVDLEIPVHFILGEHDKIASPQLCLSHMKRSNYIQTTVIEGAGHMLPLERSKELARALTETITL